MLFTPSLPAARTIRVGAAIRRLVDNAVHAFRRWRRNRADRRDLERLDDRSRNELELLAEFRRNELGP